MIPTMDQWAAALAKIKTAVQECEDGEISYTGAFSLIKEALEEMNA